MSWYKIDSANFLPAVLQCHHCKWPEDDIAAACLEGQVAQGTHRVLQAGSRKLLNLAWLLNLSRCHSCQASCPCVILLHDCLPTCLQTDLTHGPCPCLQKGQVQSQNPTRPDLKMKACHISALSTWKSKSSTVFEIFRHFQAEVSTWKLAKKCWGLLKIARGY